MRFGGASFSACGAGKDSVCASSFSMEKSGPRTSVRAMLTITRFHCPLANSDMACEARGASRTRQPSESRTFLSARWLTTSSSMIRIPTSAKEVSGGMQLQYSRDEFAASFGQVQGFQGGLDSAYRRIQSE